jgi:hypothetical protein
MLRTSKSTPAFIRLGIVHGIVQHAHGTSISKPYARVKYTFFSMLRTSKSTHAFIRLLGNSTRHSTARALRTSISKPYARVKYAFFSMLRTSKSTPAFIRLGIVHGIVQHAHGTSISKPYARVKYTFITTTGSDASA